MLLWLHNFNPVRTRQPRSSALQVCGQTKCDQVHPCDDGEQRRPDRLAMGVVLPLVLPANDTRHAAEKDEDSAVVCMNVGHVGAPARLDIAAVVQEAKDWLQRHQSRNDDAHLRVGRVEVLVVVTPKPDAAPHAGKHDEHGNQLDPRVHPDQVGEVEEPHHERRERVESQKGQSHQCAMRHSDPLLESLEICALLLGVVWLLSNLQESVLLVGGCWGISKERCYVKRRRSSDWAETVVVSQASTTRNRIWQRMGTETWPRTLAVCLFSGARYRTIPNRITVKALKILMVNW